MGPRRQDRRGRHLDGLVVSVAPARRVALDVISRVRDRAAFSGPVLDAALSRAGLSPADAALATRLARGTLAATGTLDEALDRFIAKPRALEPRVRDALRLAAYELLFTHVEPRAAVHQGVEAVRSVRPQAAGLANAVLRKLAEAAPAYPWGDPDTDVEALARLTAHPLWLAQRLVGRYGMAAAHGIMDADQEPGPLYLWVNPFAGSDDGAFSRLTEDGAEPVPGPLPGCLVAGRPSSAVRGTAVTEGIVLITDAAAQIAPRILGPAPGSLVVDLTAGRGTKTAELQALAVSLGGPARLIAVDLHSFKTDVLRKRLADLGVPDVTVVAGDATDPALPGLPSAGTADAVLLDAPCSGLGSLRRHPEARWRITEEQVGELSVLQGRLLAAAARLVRPGGAVVYSTCTILPEENEDVVRGFLGSTEGAGCRIRPVHDAVPEAWSGYITGEGFFQSLPTLGGPDGHFVALLERME
jgi:16S rRNA (cytosine967-C5)-methyltransferase